MLATVATSLVALFTNLSRMENKCTFSSCRKYRYTLEHRWDEMMPRRAIMWIGLNPSTADENQLDNTLRFIRGFSTVWGFNCFVMTNIFAWRDTKPADMKRAADPVGPENDQHLLRVARECEVRVAAWGGHGSHLGRSAQVRALLRDFDLQCIGKVKSGEPFHPLYRPFELPLVPFS